MAITEASACTKMIPVRLDCRVLGFKANCLLVGPGIIGGMPSVGVFLRDPSPYLREFRRKPRDA